MDLITGVIEHNFKLAWNELETRDISNKRKRPRNLASLVDIMLQKELSAQLTSLKVNNIREEKTKQMEFW